MLVLSRASSKTDGCVSLNPYFPALNLLLCIGISLRGPLYLRYRHASGRLVSKLHDILVVVGRYHASSLLWRVERCGEEGIGGLCS